MLSVEQSKKILGKKATHLNDEQILALRDSLYSIVNLIFDNLQKKQIKKDEKNEYATANNGI